MRFRDPLLVFFAGVLVGGFGVVEFVAVDEAAFLGPTFGDGSEAPLRAAFGGADGFVIDDDPDGIAVGGSENTHCNPAAAIDLHIEADFAKFAIGRNSFFGDRVAIDEELDLDISGVALSRPFDMPVGFLALGFAFHDGIDLFIEPAGEVDLGGNFSGFVQFNFAIVSADFLIVDGKVHEVAAAVADVIASRANSFAPFVVGEFAIDFDIAAAQPDALAIDTGEVGLAADAGAIADVESVIPDVELPDHRSVYGGNEINRRNEVAFRSFDEMSDIDNVFICADAIVGWDFKVR